MRSRLALPLALAAAVLLSACGAANPGAGGSGAPKTTSSAAEKAPALPNPPIWTPQLPSDAHTVVNGCNPTAISPAGPFGMCLRTPPHFSCCSAGAVAWSGIVAGARLEIAGAVPLDPKTGRPQSTAVVLLGPHKWYERIPVAASGAFGRRITFGGAGQYQLGVLYQGKPANLMTFAVAWRYDVRGGRTLAQIFPRARSVWPKDDLFLAAPLGARATWRIALEDASGRAQPGVLTTQEGQRSDAHGVAQISLPAKTGLGPPWYLAPGLYAQTYVDIRLQGGALTGFPGGGSLPAAGTTQDGAPYYDAQSFFRLADGLTTAPAAPDQQPGFQYDAKAGVLTLSSADSGAVARLLVAQGTVQTGRWQVGPQPTIAWSDAGQVRPIARQGHIYLTVPDLAVLGSAIAWAAPDGHGGLYFSDSYLP